MISNILWFLNRCLILLLLYDMHIIIAHSTIFITMNTWISCFSFRSYWLEIIWSRIPNKSDLINILYRYLWFRWWIIHWNLVILKLILRITRIDIRSIHILMINLLKLYIIYEYIGFIYFIILNYNLIFNILIKY